MKKSAGILAAIVLACSGIAPALGASPDGEWTGQIHCSPLRGDPVKFPAFSNPISMVVTGRNVSFTRDTSIVHEALTGKLAANGYASLSGEGRFKSGNRQPWTTNIEGQFSGSNFNGRGDVLNPDGTRVRDCTVELAQVVIAQPRVAQRSDPKPAVVAAAPASRDVKQPERSGSNVTPVQPPVSSQAVATSNPVYPSSTAVRGVIKPEQAYYCGVYDGQRVERFIAKDGRYIERWRSSKDEKPHLMSIGRWKLESLNGDSRLTLTDEMIFQLEENKWTIPDRTERVEKIVEGKQAGIDFESLDGRRVYMRCSKADEATSTLQEWIKDLFPKSQEARSAISQRQAKARQEQEAVKKKQQDGDRGLSPRQIADRDIGLLAQRRVRNEALGQKCILFVKQSDFYFNRAVDFMTKGDGMKQGGNMMVANTYYEYASADAQNVLKFAPEPGCL